MNNKLHQNNHKSYQICARIPINETDRTLFSNLDDLIYELYSILYRISNIEQSDIQIVCYSMGIPVTVLNIDYQNGLILYNNENRIKISSILPECTASDTFIAKKFDHVDKNISVTAVSSKPSPFCTKIYDSRVSTMNRAIPNISCSPIPNISCNSISNINCNSIPNITSCQIPNITTETHHDTPIQNKIWSHTTNNNDTTKTRHNNLLNKAKIAQQSVINNKIIHKPKKAAFDEDFEAEKERIRNEKILQNKSNEKFRIFESDKKSYQLIKQDILNDKLRSDEINPIFALKYDIFKLLEIRNSINFESNDNISEEYNIFMELYDECVNTEDDDKKSNANVYIPPNYNYMSDEKKNEYAKKYKMTRRQFEEKYINCMHDDTNDDIESFMEKMVQSNTLDNKILQSNTLDNKIIQSNTLDNKTMCSDSSVIPHENVNMVKESGSDLDSDSDFDSEFGSESESDIAPIDSNFIELAKQYGMNF